MGIAAPFFIAGKKCICLTVATVAWSNPNPAQRTTCTSPTSPSAPMSTVTSTVASASASALRDAQEIVPRRQRLAIHRHGGPVEAAASFIDLHGHVLVGVIYKQYPGGKDHEGL